MSNFKSKGTESGNQASSSTGGGGITSFISGLLWSGGDTACTDSHARESKPDQGDGALKELGDRGTNLDKSWEDVPMAEPVVASQPRVEVTSSKRDCYEVGQQLSDLQKRFENLEGVIQTQGKRIKEHQKGKWPLRLRKQPSKDKGDECAQVIQGKVTQIREKESEIRERDSQIRYYQRKLTNAEALDEQNSQLAAELSEKENKFQELSRHLIDLQQEMKTIIAKNSALKKQITEDQAKHEDEVKKLIAKVQGEACSNSCVLISDKDSKHNWASEKEEVARLRSRIATLEADLDKSIVHSKAQSCEILKLKQHIQGTELEKEECLQSSQGLLEDSETRVFQLQQQLRQVMLERDNLKSANEWDHKRERDSDQELLEMSIPKDVQDLRKEICTKDTKIKDLQRQLKSLNTEKQAFHLQVATYKSDFEEERRDRERIYGLIDDLVKENVQVEGRAALESAQALADVHARLMDKERQLQKLTEENNELKEKLVQAEAQVRVYKFDFEEERRDRERIHGLIDDMKKKVMQVEGLAAEERAAYEKRLNEVNQELQHTRKLLHEHKALLADAEKLNQRSMQDAQRSVDKSGGGKKQDDRASKQRDSQTKNTKGMLDMVTKQRDQLKKQNEQLTKQIDQLKKKGEVSPDLPPEDNPTLLEIEFAHQRADDANKRADTATAKAMEAERRAKEAEQQAKAARMKHLEAEAHNIALEKKLDETYIQLQKMSSEIERLNMENEQLCLQQSQHIPSSVPQFAHVVQVMPISKQSKNQSDGECKSSKMVSPLAHPNQPDANPDHKESRTTHLEKRLDKMLLDMQNMAAENEKLRDEVSQMKAANEKSGMATIASSSELGAPQQYKEIHALGKDDARKPIKELPPLRLRARALPPTTRERSRSPSPVAIVKPMSQSPNSQAPHQWQASVGSIMIQAIPSAYSVSPPLPHAHYYNQQQQQQQINSVENDKIGVGTNPQMLKPNLVEEHDDRPYDPNLVCPTCRKQFRIGEIQEYKKHYKICHMKRSVEPPARHSMAGGTQPFTPIPPSMGCQSGINKDTQAAEPKVLCRTPGCSFKGYEDLGGLCPDCHGNIQDDLV